MSQQRVVRYPVYDQLSVQNNCGEPGWFSAREPQFVKSSGCEMLNLLEAFDRLGDIPIHLAGDSLTRYTYLSLRWARRRAVLHARFCSFGSGRRPSPALLALGDTSSGLSRWFWSVMKASQGLEGD